MKARSFFSVAGVLLAVALIFSCSEAQAAGQSDFYGVWRKSDYAYFEINKDAITMLEFHRGFEKHKYRIVKWEKGSKDKSFIVYTLDEDNKKIDFKVSIDAYSDLQIDGAEAKKSSAAELNKLIKKDAAEKAAREAAAQKAAKAVVQRGSFSDQRDGKTYKTVKIGSQIWMAENLNYDAKDSKCYDNQPANCTNYGRLYDWATAKSACPSGWHLPSKDEWQELEDFAGGDEVAETYLKAKDGWGSDNCNGTDSYGFSALPGGIGFSSDGSFSGIDDDYNRRRDNRSGYWWSTSEYEGQGRIRGGQAAYSYNMGCIIYRHLSFGFKSHLQSVRCLQD